MGCCILNRIQAEKDKHEHVYYKHNLHENANIVSDHILERLVEEQTN